MKKIAWLTALVLVGQMVSAQVVRPALDDDPVFHKVLHDRIDYPSNTFYFPLYGRVYAGFCIDAKGKVGNVMILSPGNTRSGFEYEVVHALKHMPILNPNMLALMSSLSRSVISMSGRQTGCIDLLIR